MPKIQWEFFYNVTPLFKTLRTGLAFQLFDTCQLQRVLWVNTDRNKFIWLTWVEPGISGPCQRVNPGTTRFWCACERGNRLDTRRFPRGHACTFASIKLAVLWHTQRKRGHTTAALRCALCMEVTVVILLKLECTRHSSYVASTVVCEWIRS